MDGEKARADREDRLFTAASAENAELKVAAALQAEDKDYLVKQVMKQVPQGPQRLPPPPLCCFNF